MRAAIYIRVSSEEQARHGYSLDAQRAACRERALALGAEAVLECADEGVSGTLLDRPGLTRLRELVHRGEVDRVIIYDPDRFARRLSHQLLVTEEIERAGVILEFINFEWQDTPEGKLFYSLRGAIAEYEREKIRLRTTAGRLQKARSGKLPFAFEPYGYRYDKIQAQLVVNPEEAVVVHRIFRELATAHASLNGLAKALTADGVRTRMGRPTWHRQVVRQIARNPVYLGIYYANQHAEDPRHGTGSTVRNRRDRTRPREEWIAVAVPTLVDPEIWHAAQKAMDGRAEGWRSADRGDYLLSGLLRCGGCGRTMTGHRTNHWGRKVFEYTCRKTTAGSPLSECHHRVDRDVLDATVWRQVVSWLTDTKELQRSWLQEQGPESALVRRLRTVEERLQKARRARETLLTALDDQLVGGEDALGHLKTLRAREVEWDAEQRRLRTQVAAERSGTMPALDDDEARQWLARLEEDLPLTERRRIVGCLITRVVVGRGDLTLYARGPNAWRS